MLMGVFAILIGTLVIQSTLMQPCFCLTMAWELRKLYMLTI
jgi:hypothetical protein